MKRRPLLVQAAAAAVAAAWSSLTRATPAALIAAAEAGDIAALRRLLDAGTPVDARDGRQRTALLAATQANRIEAARLLIERGADVNAQDELQDSPFLYAGAEGRLEILRLTLAAGADLKSTNRYGGTALIPAAHHGHVETVRELLKTTIDLNHVNRLGWTALLEAIILGAGGAAQTEIVRLLVARGANVNIADAQGVTPLVHAEQRGQVVIADMLRRAGAPVQQRGLVLLIRHALTEPGTGDPAGFRLGECSTQRNLSDAGRLQARRLGEQIRQRGWAPQRVRSSAWCRCLDTAQLAFGSALPWPALNSFFEGRGAEPAQTAELRRALAAVGPGQIEAWVTHQVNMTALTGASAAMGEVLVLQGGRADATVLQRMSV